MIAEPARPEQASSLLLARPTPGAVRVEQADRRGEGDDLVGRLVVEDVDQRRVDGRLLGRKRDTLELAAGDEPPPGAGDDAREGAVRKDGPTPAGTTGHVDEASDTVRVRDLRDDTARPAADGMSA